MDILNIPIIKVKDSRGENVYNRVRGESNIPNYYPNTDLIPYGESKDSITCECFFLPIEQKTFIRDRKNKFYGFRYLYTTGEKMISVQVANDEKEFNKMIDMELTVRVQRFLYHIENDYDVCIERYCSTIHPPITISIKATPNKLLEAVNTILEETILGLNKWYIERKI